MRRGRALRALLTGVVAGLATAPVWLVWGPAQPAVAAPCTGPSGIEVVVEYDALGRTTARDCAAPGGDRTAAALFERTGHPQVQVQRYPGAVCRVDGLPGATGARGTNCVDMPPADNYWALFWSNGSGAWVYSQLGAYSLEVPEGGKVAWVWQDSGARNTPDTTSQRVQAQPSPSPSPTPAPGDSVGNGGSGDRDGAGGSGSGDGGDSGGTDSGTDSGTDPGAGAGGDAEGSAAGPEAGRGERGAGGSGLDRERPGAVPSDRGARSDRQDREGGRDERGGLGGRDATAQSYDDQATSAPAADPASGDSGGLPPWLPLGVVGALLVIAAAVAVVRARRSG